MPGDEGEFSEFVRSSSRALLRTAWLLAGDSDSAQDLVQAALAHTWLRWDRIRSKGAAEAYVQRVMVTTILGCSVGAVKSQSSRAMRALRATPGLHAAISGESV